jgi:hypothetical protein
MTFDGFVRPTRNFFPMPNGWIDICAEIDSMSEIKVLQYILRHTWGFHEYGIPKTISTDEFEHGRKRTDGTRMDKGTGLSNKSVIAGLRRAEEHGYIVSVTDTSDLARTNKSYMLRMQPDIPCVESTQASDEQSTPYGDSTQGGYEQPTHLAGDSTHRSEKDTLEKQFRKTTEEAGDIPIVIATIGADAPTATAPISLFCNECGSGLEVIGNRVSVCACQTETVRMAAIRVGGSPMATGKPDEGESDAPANGEREDAPPYKGNEEAFGDQDNSRLPVTIPSSRMGVGTATGTSTSVPTRNALPDESTEGRTTEDGFTLPSIPYSEVASSTKTFLVEKNKIEFDAQGFSPQGRAIYDGLCTLLNTPSLKVYPQTAPAANEIAPAVLRWADLLGLDVANTLKDFRTWMIEAARSKAAKTGKESFYGPHRSIKLTDMLRELEDWTSAKASELDAKERAATPQEKRAPRTLAERANHRFTAEELAPRFANVEQAS